MPARNSIRMHLEYKPDWEETKERYRAWWAHEYFGRCAISVTAPKADLPPVPPPPAPARIEDRWLDPDYLRAANEYRLSRTFFGGEALPVWNPGYPGWASHSCCLGARVELDEATGWVYPLWEEGALTDYDYRSLVIRPDSPWYVRSQEILRLGAAESRGRSLCTIGAFGATGDTLAQIRGTGKLLLDVADCPDYVRECDLYLTRQWMEMYDAYYQIIQPVDEGSTSWFQVWSPGKTYGVQNDFAYMISPRTFQEVFLPSLELQLEFLDHPIYHVDGEGNFRHVDTLCQLGRLPALQILPGSGKPSPLHYLDVLRRVQAAGKNLHITIPPEEVEPALELLSARGLFIDTWCRTEEEARTLLKNCERWSRESNGPG